ncbi:glycosyltransferase family 2 protein [Aerococcus urinaeequi]|uniref:glycosyltransferase family 2 protein n=1 Tax=Aerococcus urinaeequi TaxID=51665 RepID=UPI003ED9E733
MKVSVVIPTHKRPDSVCQAIDSVLNQTYNDIEIIVVSDGKDEFTDKALKPYLDKNLIRYFTYEDSRGANYARNTGVRASSGKAVAFLDDDDEWDESKIEKQIRVLENDPSVGLVYTGNYNIYTDLNIKYSYIPSKKGDISTSIFERNYIGSTSSVMVLRDLILKVGGFDEKLPAIQDYDLWIRVCQVTNIGVVPEPLLFYYNELNNNQISSNTKKYKIAEKIILKKYNYLIEGDNKLKVNLKNHFFETVIIKCLRNGDKKTAYKETIRYLKFSKSLNAVKYFFMIPIPYMYILKLRTFKS